MPERGRPFARLDFRSEPLSSLAPADRPAAFWGDETPWRERVDDPDRLVVLNATREATILLDYRAPGEPVVMRARDLTERGLDDARSYDVFDALVGRLRAFRPKA